jgi:hypothetical protein
VRAYRVFPWVRNAKAGEPGHALYLAPRNSAGRLDNPDHYRVLYVATNPTAAVAERFGSFELWTAAMLAGPPALKGSRQALAQYEIPDDLIILDLDDGPALVTWGLRPSQVITRERATTQAWALRLFQTGRFAGVRWWSFYNPDWGSIGLWNITKVTLVDVVELKPDSEVLTEARAFLMRSWIS